MIPFVPNPPTPLPAQDLKYTNYHQFHPLVSYSSAILILGNISKRQNIRILFQRFVNLYAKYSIHTPEEIEADEEIFEAVLELDAERCQIR